jgi:hypothetical protein
MARTGSWTWTVIISLLVGAVGASVFWLYSPPPLEQAARQVAGKSKTQPTPGPGSGGLPKMPAHAMGPRFQMVADSKQAFMVDLKTGRVWRYFHQTKAEGFSRDDEGFLPIPFYYAGKKHYSAAEIEAPPGDPANPTSPPPEED